MSNVVAIMSMSLDGFVADPNDGVDEVFDWYFNSGDVEFETGGADPMTFKVSAASAAGVSFLTALPRPAVLGNPRVIQGVGVTHLRYPVTFA